MLSLYATPEGVGVVASGVHAQYQTGAVRRGWWRRNGRVQRGNAEDKRNQHRSHGSLHRSSSQGVRQRRLAHTCSMRLDPQPSLTMA